MNYNLHDPGSAAQVVQFRMRLDEQGMGGGKVAMFLCKVEFKTSPREAEMEVGVKHVVARANVFQIWVLIR